MNDMMKNVEMNTAAQNTTAIVPTNSTLSTVVQQPAAPAPTDTEMIETTFTDDKEQTPAAAPADEKKKPKKHRNVEHCKVDFDKKAIVLTKEFAKRASIIDSPEFNRLSDLCRAYPHLKVITRTAKKSTTRPSMKGLTKDFMEKHIKTLHNADWNLYLRQQAKEKYMTADYIYTHDYTYDFLVCFFLPEIYDPFFRQDYAAEIEEDERLAYSRYIAALLPYEKDYDQIVQKLYDKEDAIAASSFFILMPSAPV